MAKDKRLNMAKKSFMARLVATYLQLTNKARGNVSQQETFEHFAKVKEQGEQPYAIPKMVNFRCEVQKDTLYGADVYTLNGNSKVNKTIFYFHGGGYVHRPRIFHWIFLNKLVAETDVKVVVPIYPLAPFHSYTEMYELIQSIYSDYVIAHPFEEVIFMGDSAGGGFAIAYYEYLVDNGYPLPHKVVALAPWVDIEMSNPDIDLVAKRDPMLVKSTAQVWGLLWANGEDLHSYMLSPLYYNKLGELSNVSLFVGTDDILYPDIVKFYNLIKDNDNCSIVIAERMNHVYPVHPIPEAKIALKQIAKIVNR